MSNTPSPTEPRYLTTLACDPGFGNFGWAVVRFPGRYDVILEMGVVRSKKAHKKQHLHANEDSFDRMRGASELLQELVRRYRVDVVVFESFSIPQQASKTTMAKIAMPYGMLAMLCAVHNLPTVMLTPQAIKKSLCGKVSASKEDVEEVVHAHFAGGNAIDAFEAEVPESVRNHAWDALGAYLASLDSDIQRAMRRTV